MMERDGVMVYRNEWESIKLNNDHDDDGQNSSIPLNFGQLPLYAAFLRLQLYCTYYQTIIT